MTKKKTHKAETYLVFNINEICKKCGFAYNQAFRLIFNGSHDILVDQKVTQCNIQGEHIHFECTCGYESIRRPLDWKKRNFDQLVVDTEETE